VRGSSPAALGAALLAGGVTEGAGVRENLAAPAPPVAPNPAAARLYADLYERYLVRAAQCC
jgi:sugar (pentulose or hexulose) kinase